MGVGTFILVAGIIGFIIYWLFFREPEKGERYISEEVKRKVLERQGGTCALCQEDRTGLLEFHHKKAVSLGGTSEAKNIVALCPTCHSIKSRYDNSK
ncbi:MAG: HNH endonuclease signature motif containing protein [Nanoarchaeota archaeon]